ncbi:MAG: hypothetical protein ABMA64_39670 [Myxococcota bacterium]
MAPRLDIATIPPGHHDVPGDHTSDATLNSPSFSLSVYQRRTAHVLASASAWDLAGNRNFATEVDEDGLPVPPVEDRHHEPDHQESRGVESPACTEHSEEGNERGASDSRCADDCTMCSTATSHAKKAKDEDGAGSTPTPFGTMARAHPEIVNWICGESGGNPFPWEGWEAYYGDEGDPGTGATADPPCNGDGTHTSDEDLGTPEDETTTPADATEVEHGAGETGTYGHQTSADTDNWYLSSDFEDTYDHFEGSDDPDSVDIKDDAVIITDPKVDEGGGDDTPEHPEPHVLLANLGTVGPYVVPIVLAGGDGPGPVLDIVALGVAVGIWIALKLADRPVTDPPDAGDTGEEPGSDFGMGENPMETDLSEVEDVEWCTLPSKPWVACWKDPKGKLDETNIGIRYHYDMIQPCKPKDSECL